MLCPAHPSACIPRATLAARVLGAARVGALASLLAGCPAVLELDDPPDASPPTSGGFDAGPAPTAGLAAEAGALPLEAQAVQASMAAPNPAPAPAAAVQAPSVPCAGSAPALAAGASPRLVPGGARAVQVDALDTALRLVEAAGYVWPCQRAASGAMPELDEGYEVLAYLPGEPCADAMATRYRLSVSRAGIIAVLGTVPADEPGACATGESPAPP